MIYTRVYKEDLVEAQQNIPNLKDLKGKSIFITGAGGLICSAIVDFLFLLNDLKDYKMKIFVGARDKTKIYERFKIFIHREDFHFIQYDANKPLKCKYSFDYIIHGAGNANPALYIKQPVETMLGNILGIKNILEYSIKFPARKVLYISSSEVYGKKENVEIYNEEDYNFLDILDIRACYPSAKRATETLCIAYLKEFGIKTVIARPGHIFGPTVTKNDNRASSQFAKDVLLGKDIIMKSSGNQLRSYCYVIDCVTAILTILLNGKAGEAYNISNESSLVSIRDVAEEFAKISDRKVIFENPSEEETKSYNLMSNSCLSSKKLELLGWTGKYNLKKGVKHTYECMIEAMEDENGK